MSTMPAASQQTLPPTVAPTVAPPVAIPVPFPVETENQTYFKKLSTQMQILFFVIPLVMGIGGSYMQSTFAQQAQARDMAQTQELLKDWQKVKEQRGIQTAVQGEQITTLQGDVRGMRDDMKGIQSDIKTLLMRSGKVSE